MYSVRSSPSHLRHVEIHVFSPSIYSRFRIVTECLYSRFGRHYRNRTIRTWASECGNIRAQLVVFINTNININTCALCDDGNVMMMCSGRNVFRYAMLTSSRTRCTRDDRNVSNRISNTNKLLAESVNDFCKISFDI